MAGKVYEINQKNIVLFDYVEKLSKQANISYLGVSYGGRVDDSFACHQFSIDGTRVNFEFHSELLKIKIEGGRKTLKKTRLRLEDILKTKLKAA